MYKSEVDNIIIHIIVLLVKKCGLTYSLLNKKITLSMRNLFYCRLLFSSLTPETKQKHNARKQDITFQSMGIICQKKRWGRYHLH